MPGTIWTKNKEHVPTRHVARAVEDKLIAPVLNQASRDHIGFGVIFGRQRDPAFAQIPTPVSAEYLAREGVSPTFVEYLRKTLDGLGLDADAALSVPRSLDRKRGLEC